MISEDKYIKLNVQGLLDLETLSQEYQIPKNELIRFHNSYCEIGELLPLNLPKYVPFIYIPKNNFESRNGKLIPNSSLKYPSHRNEKNYGVIIKYLHSALQIHFEVNIKREASRMVINKKRNFVNNEEVENLIEKLFEKAEQTIYPLSVSVNGNGSFSKIENEEEITERWKNDSLPKLKEYYVGETAEEILKKMDRVFHNLNSKKDFLLHSFFYQFLFLPVYQTYSGYTKEGKIDLYFAPFKKRVSYNISYYLNREFTRGTKIALQITGNEQDGLTNDEKRGTVDLLYKFRNDTHELFSVTGSASTFDKGKESVIEFQMFEI